MMEIDKNSLGFQILQNAFRFLVNVGFVFVFQMIFGMENTLVGVAIGVGFTMLPMCNLDLKPMTMFLIIVLLYGGSGLIGQVTLINPWLAFIGNFLFVSLIILLSNEPLHSKPNISFLLCFVFAQSTVVKWEQFPMRMMACVIGGLFVGGCVLWRWHSHHYGGDIGFKEQILRCQKNRSYLLRMSFGIALAMLIGSLLQLRKPLWISIVVMSLTQLEFSETLERIKHRFIGTLIGVVLFFIFFQVLIPQKYAIWVVMLLGYVGFFLPDYKYKQVINAVSALNASLVILDTMTAIETRILCLTAGILILLMIYLMTKLIRKLHIKSMDLLKNQIDQFFLNMETKKEVAMK